VSKFAQVSKLSVSKGSIVDVVVKLYCADRYTLNSSLDPPPPQAA